MGREACFCKLNLVVRLPAVEPMVVLVVGDWPHDANERINKGMGIQKREIN